MRRFGYVSDTFIWDRRNFYCFVGLKIVFKVEGVVYFRLVQSGLRFRSFRALRWVSGQSLSLNGGKPFACFPPDLWERDCPEMHLIGCSTGPTFYKVSWNILWFFFFAAVRFLTTSWWLIDTSWVTLLKVYHVERPETLNDLGKNITDDVVRGTCRCIP